MGMSLGGSGSQKADINITPMIDVLLVLIMIYFCQSRLGADPGLCGKAECSGAVLLAEQSGVSRCYQHCRRNSL